MALDNFIREVWSAKILNDFQTNAVVTTSVSRDFEQEAAGAKTVHIPGVTPVAIHDYKAGAVKDADGNAIARTTTPDDVTDTGVDLNLDQEKAFDFLVDDIDAAQSGNALNAYTMSAAEGLVNDADLFLTTLAVTNGTTVTGTATDGKTAWNVIRDLRKQLNKAKAPQGDRFLIVNAEFAALLESADSKLTEADTSGSPDGLREATLGRVLGFTVLNTENTPTTAKPQAIAYSKSALAFASQIDKTEALRAEQKFADRVRGLHVYGGKVLIPARVAVYTGA